MLINVLFKQVQQILKPIYNKSFFLQNLDWLIGLNIVLVIISSSFAQSDQIGYFAMFAIFLTLVKMLTKAGEVFEMSIADKFLLLYFIFALISVAGSSLFVLSLKGFLKTVTYLGFYISVVHYLKENTKRIRYIFFAFVLCVFFESIIAFLQNIGAVEEISGWQDMSRLNPEEVMTRVYGTLKPYNPNLFGGYILSLLPAIIPMPFINKKLLFPSIIVGISAFLSLIFTGCRGAYIGFFFELIVLIILSYNFLKHVYKKIFSLIIAAGVMVLSFIITSVSSIKARIFSIFAMRNDSSNSFRFNVYNSCIQMFKDNWLLGIGCGNQNFREIYGLYMKTGFDALSAYNIYLEIAVESGVFALITFLGFLVANIYKAIKFILSARTVETIFVISAMISIIGIMFHGLVDTVFFRPQIQFAFWIFIAIIRVLVR